MEDKLEEIHFADQVYSLTPSEANSTTGCIFLGGKEAAQDREFLSLKNIKSVLTMASTAVANFTSEEGIENLIIDADDTSTYEISKDFLPTFNFIDEKLKYSNVLVHCEKGISRSPSIVIAYIMRKEKRLLSDVLQSVRKYRKEISVNGGFIFHLSKLQDQLKAEFQEEFENNNQKKQIIYQSQAPIRFFRSKPLPQPQKID